MDEPYNIVYILQDFRPHFLIVLDFLRSRFKICEFSLEFFPPKNFVHCFGRKKKTFLLKLLTKWYIYLALLVRFFPKFSPKTSGNMPDSWQEFHKNLHHKCRKLSTKIFDFRIFL